jgi:uncharacterized membrane protein YhiD involved in acid resistance
MNDIYDISTIFQLSLSPGTFVRNLVVALICGIGISRFYCWTSKSPNASRTFVSSLISLTMITAVVILVIGNNLARAFGLVGAMSIIRFRTAVKDVQDIVFIFFSLAIGMAAGIGQSMIAFIGTLSIGTVIIVISQIQAFSDTKRDFLLQFSFVPSAENEAPYLPILNKHCSKNHLINMKYLEYDQFLELSFYVKLKKPDKKDGFMSELSKIKGVKNINLFFDEE